MHFPPLCIHWSGILRNLVNMAKIVYIFLKFCSCITSNGGAVVESQAADPEVGASPPTCVLWFTKSWRAKRKITHFRKLYAISA